MSAPDPEHADDRKVEPKPRASLLPIFAWTSVGLAVLTAVVVFRLPPPSIGASKPTDSQTSWRVAKGTPAFVPLRRAQPVVAVPTPPPPFKRRQMEGEEDLRSRLYQVARELDIEAVEGTTIHLLLLGDWKTPLQPPNAVGGFGDKKEVVEETSPVFTLVAQRADLKGLPMRNLVDCQVSAAQAKSMQQVSNAIRSAMETLGIGLGAENQRDSQERDRRIIHNLEKLSWWRREDVGGRLLVHMLQTQNHAVRFQLVRMLGDNKAKNAGALLAQRAVFDLDPIVRERAIKGLKGRPRDEYRSVLLEALRYPWSAVADHAAEALVALDDKTAVIDLVNLLDSPDPEVPAQDGEGKWNVAELVRINHLGNCVLCHAPSFDRSDSVRGSVPRRSVPLPTVMYYEDMFGDFVRADVTYLRQDFSVMHSVSEPGKWPRNQRFDYLIRKRELSAEEVSCLEDAREADTPNLNSYPQREAVLWALRELTGYDAGSRSEGWRRYLMDERD